LKAVSDFIYRLSVWTVCVLVGIMTCVTLLDVFVRNVLGFSFSWAGELTRFIFIYTTFIGASALYKKLELTGFDMVTQKLPRDAARLIFKVMQVIIIVFCVIVIYSGIVSSFSKTIMMQHAPGLGISMTIPYLAIPIGMTFTLIHALTFLIYGHFEKNPSNEHVL